MQQAQYVVDALKAQLADQAVELAVAKHTIAEQEQFILDAAPRLGLRVEVDDQGRKTLVPDADREQADTAPLEEMLSA